jgi:hypothetical protein
MNSIKGFVDIIRNSWNIKNEENFVSALPLAAQKNYLLNPSAALCLCFEFVYKKFLLAFDKGRSLLLNMIYYFAEELIEVWRLYNFSDIFTGAQKRY